MLREIPDYINNHIISFSITGFTSAGIASAPTEYHFDYLRTHALGVLSYSEWIQVISFIYVLSLLIMLLPKIFDMFAKGLKGIFNVLDEISKRP